METEDGSYPDFWDRVCSAGGLCLLAFLTGVVVWLLVIFGSMAAMYNWVPPFIWVVNFSLVFSILGFVIPEKALGLLEYIWKQIGSVFSGDDLR